MSRATSTAMTRAAVSRRPSPIHVHSAVEARNQHEDVVLSFTAMNFFARRPKG